MSLFSFGLPDLHFRSSFLTVAQVGTNGYTAPEVLRGERYVVWIEVMYGVRRGEGGLSAKK